MKRPKVTYNYLQPPQKFQQPSTTHTRLLLREYVISMLSRFISRDGRLYMGPGRGGGGVFTQPQRVIMSRFTSTTITQRN